MYCFAFESVFHRFAQNVMPDRSAVHMHAAASFENIIRVAYPGLQSHSSADNVNSWFRRHYE